MRAETRTFRRARLSGTFRPTLLLAALALAGLAGQARAIDVYWDPNLGAPGIGGSGNWDDLQTNWSLSASGIQFLIPELGFHSGIPWPDGAGSVAVFGGTGGTVSVLGTQIAGGLRFLTDGHEVQGGALRLVPSTGSSVSVEVAEGATARLSTTLEMTSPLVSRPSLVLAGPGTLTLSPTNPLDTVVDVQKGTLRAGTSSALASTFVKVSGNTAQFTVGSLRTVALAGIDMLQSTLDLDSASLLLSGSGSLGATSHLEAGISGNRASGIVVGTAGWAPLVIGRPSDVAPASSFGFLRLAQGSVTITGTDVTLTALQSATPDSLGALQLDALGELNVSLGARLTVTSAASLVGGSEIVVSSGSFLSVIRDATRPDLPATLAVGTSAGPAGVRVSGAGSTISSADQIVLGKAALRDAGTGLLVAAAGGAIDAPVLAFGSASSRLLLNPGGTGRFNRLDGGGAGLGTVEMAGGTLIVGDTSFTSPLASADSGFGGSLIGSTGTLRKIGSGEFSLTGATNYLGNVHVESGTLRVRPGTLTDAVLTLTPGAHLAVSGLASAASFGIGALEGSFDLDQENAILEFGGGQHEARWRGRFTAGTVGLSRTAGPGIQTFEGGSESAPFTAPFLSVGIGTVRLSGGHFVFTQVSSTGADRSSLSVSGTVALVEIADGAVVRAGSAVRAQGGGTLRVTGAGSRLDVQPDPATGRSSLFVGRDFLGALEVTQGGTVTTDTLAIGPERAVNTVAVTVSAGGLLSLSRLAFGGYGGSLVVDGGHADIRSLEAPYHDPSFASVIRLTDPTSGAPALTLGDPDAAPGTSTRFRGLILDGLSGPGSLRKIGPDEIIANPRISGRLIIDDGVFRVEDPVALLNTTVELNRSFGLAFSTPGGSNNWVGALTGAGNLAVSQGVLAVGSNGRNATFDGAVDLEGGLDKVGTGTQVLTGGGRLAFVNIESGTLHLRGGTYDSVPGRFGITVNGSLTDSQLRLSAGAQLDNALGTTDLRSAQDVAAVLLLTDPNTRLTTNRLQVVSRGTASVEVANGASLDIRHGIGTTGGGITFVVDRATVETGPSFVADSGTVVSISDPLALPGQTSFTRPAAWTVTTAPEQPGYVSFFDYRGNFSDGPSGPGSIAFVGSGFRAALSGQLTYTGRTIVDGADVVLEVRSPIASREFIARNGGLFDLSAPPFAAARDVSNRTFRTDATGVIRYDGLQLVGGTLRGTGHEVAVRGATFDGTSLVANSRLTARGGVTWSNASISGVLDSRAGASLDNVILTPSGSVVLGGPATFTDVENNGVLDLKEGAALTLASPMVSGGGSQVLLARGATLGGEALTLRGALLVNNGTVASPLAVDFGSLAMGAGTFGAVTVNRGGTFSPGNSPGIAHTGSVTFNEGGAYEVEIADALGAPGTGFDLWDIAGNLDFNAGTTANSRFVISLVSLDGSDAPGPAANFDKRHRFAWTVLRADSVSGFDANELRLDTDGFANDHDGQFALALRSVDGRSELQIVYQPVPEPATNALIVAGLATLLAWRRRRV